MTELTKEQSAELEALIRKAVPESMELKFGCRLTRHFDGNDYDFRIKEDRGESHGIHRYFVESMPNGSMGYEVTNAAFSPHGDWLEILGRPLNLFDIKIALLENRTAWRGEFLEIATEWGMPNDLSKQNDKVWKLLQEYLAPSN